MSFMTDEIDILLDNPVQTIDIEFEENELTIPVTFDESEQVIFAEFGEELRVGEDQVPFTHSWDGTVLTISSSSGTSSADLKGDPGKDGKDGVDGKTPDSYVIQWMNRWDGYPRGHWEINLYKNGALCTEQLYAQVLYTQYTNEFPDNESSASGYFTGTITWSANNAIRYLVNIFEDSSKSKLLTSAFLTPAR